MIVGGKEGLGPQTALVGAVFEHGAGYGHAVVGGGAAAYLVEEDEAAARGGAEYARHLAHLHHEGALPGREVVRGADAREHPVHNAERGAPRRDEGAYLGHEHDQRRLAHVGALAGHVRAGYDEHALVRLVEVGVVGHEERVLLQPLDHRVAAVFDVDGAGEVELRPAVVVADGGLCEGAEGVHHGYLLRRGLDALHAVGDGVPQVAEVLVLQLADPLLSCGELGLELLELGGEIALVGDEGLLADIVLGQLAGEGLGHVDVVAVDPVIAYLEALYASALALGRLHLGYQLGALVADVAQAVHLLGIALAQDAALVD